MSYNQPPQGQWQPSQYPYPQPVQSAPRLPFSKRHPIWNAILIALLLVGVTALCIGTTIFLH